MCWVCYWYGRCRNACRLLMGKLVANINMVGQKGEGRMMLRWVLKMGHVRGKSVELLRIALEVGFGISALESKLLVTSSSIQNVF